MPGGPAPVFISSPVAGGGSADSTGGLVVSTKTQSGISGLSGNYGGGANNVTETDVSWQDASNNGWQIGMIPGYGGALLSTWYEIDTNTVGANQTNLGTSLPDDLIHWFSQDASFNFAGTENATYTLSELAPTGTSVRRYYDSGNIVQPISGFSGAALTWRVKMVIQPGEPGMFYVTMTVTNPSASAVTLNGSDGMDTNYPSGLTQALQSGTNAWQPGNGFYNTVGGTAAAWSSSGVAIDPDFFYITPQSGAGLSLGVLCVRKESLTQVSGASSLSESYNQNSSRLKQGVTATVSSFPGSTTYTFHVLVVLRRSLTGSDANSIAADYLNPDASFTNISNGSFTSHSYDEGHYQFASTAGNSISFKHSISGSVTGRWNPAYKITGWTAGDITSMAIGGTTLTSGSDYYFHVDVANSVAYVKLAREIVASGAGAGQLNNGIITISG